MNIDAIGDDLDMNQAAAAVKRAIPLRSATQSHIRILKCLVGVSNLEEILARQKVAEEAKSTCSVKKLRFILNPPLKILIQAKPERGAARD